MTIRVFEAFAGIGAQAEALRELGLDFKVVGISENDPVAVAGYEAIHGPVKNYGDIRDMVNLPPCDLVTYSYPCTSLSICGKQEGMGEGTGTASSLVWEVGRLLMRADKLPEILVMENVDAVLNIRNWPDFKRWMEMLDALGYTSTYAILNAKDYDVPQFRKRCFMISARHGKRFIFPKKVTLTRTMQDVLEENVPDSYYLKGDKIENYKVVHVKNTNGLIKIGELGKYNFEYMNRVYSPKGISPTVNTVQGGGRAIKICLGYKGKTPIVRYLTPREYFRLQCFPDDAIDRLMEAVPAKSNQYRLAGNSIPINCLKAIFKGIYIDKSFRLGLFEEIFSGL